LMESSHRETHRRTTPTLWPAAMTGAHRTSRRSWSESARPAPLWMTRLPVTVYVV
jgi:hypothetical protein